MVPEIRHEQRAQGNGQEHAGKRDATPEWKNFPQVRVTAMV
jgi:hypothetical protein